jgi:hypothetical protein
MIVVYTVLKNDQGGKEAGWWETKGREASSSGWKSAVCHGEEEESCGGKVCCAACHWRESVKVTKQQIVSIMTAAGEVLEERTPT